MDTATIVQKLWNCCNVLRDDGMSYGDYVEQLTYLLFLKMADERTTRRRTTRKARCWSSTGVGSDLRNRLKIPENRPEKQPVLGLEAAFQARNCSSKRENRRRFGAPTGSLPSGRRRRSMGEGKRCSGFVRVWT